MDRALVDARDTGQRIGIRARTVAGVDKPTTTRIIPARASQIVEVHEIAVRIREPREPGLARDVQVAFDPGVGQVS